MAKRRIVKPVRRDKPVKRIERKDRSSETAADYKRRIEKVSDTVKPPPPSKKKK